MPHSYLLAFYLWFLINRINLNLVKHMMIIKQNNLKSAILRNLLTIFN